MKLHKLALATGAMFTSLILATAAIAADPSKEGTFQGTYTAFGSYKLSKAGTHTFTTFDETGAQMTNGFADHVTLHCWGTGDTTDEMTVDRGYYVGTDPTGDQLAIQFADEKHADKDTTFKGTSTFIAGSGKFAGISGSTAYVNHGHEFKPLVEGTYVNYVTLQGNYKLP